MELTLVLAVALAACIALVVSAWRRGGTRIGLWTLGLILVGIGLAFTGALLVFVEAFCEADDCPDNSTEVALALSGAALSFLCAVATTARAGGRSRRGS